MKSDLKPFIFDTETLGPSPHGIVVSAAFIVFDFDKDESFTDLISKALYIKFDIKDQIALGRVKDKSTIEWWKKQSPEAQKKLLPSKDDVSLNDGIDLIVDYFKAHNITKSNSVGFCRGQSFDFPLITDLFKTVNREHQWPNNFWNQRDTRTYIGTMLGKIDIREVPLPKGVINNFIAHDPVHDIAKDIITMKYAEKYAFGEVEIPNGKNL